MSEKIKLRWNGHACFDMEDLETGKKLIIDPFIEGNPSSKIRKEDIKTDVVVVTHGHSDHVGSAPFICKQNNAPLVTMVELAWILSEKNEGLKVHDLNFSGTTEVAGINITAVPAMHSSSYEGMYAGNPGGMILDFGGVRIYHAGDTGLFKDMELIGSVYRPDIALLPIGGHYTMSPQDAAKAVTLINPHIAIPMHYNTFPPITQNPKIFKNLVEINSRTKVIIPAIGEEITLDSVKLHYH